MDSWEQSFFAGKRLDAEIQLLAAGFLGFQLPSQVAAGSSLLRRSHGGVVSGEYKNAFVQYQEAQPEPRNLAESRNQYLLASEIPDALLFWVLYRRLPLINEFDYAKKLYLLQRLAMLLHASCPGRFDLPYYALTSDKTSSLLRSAPSRAFTPSDWYSRPEGYMQQLQADFICGRYEQMWKSTARALFDGRSFPLTDHHIRALTILGSCDRAMFLFQQLYNASPYQFQLGSISNMFFMALGSASIDQDFVRVLVGHFNELARQYSPSALPSLADNVPKPLSVNERPLLVVVSTDLRSHPVGRFWLPIARQLRTKFQVISVAGHPRDADPLRDELKSLSDEWWPLEADGVSSIAERIRGLSPDLLIDLGGHTADNHPALLCHRLATVQATYLGFYGPTYARCCDWWIVDQVLERWISKSYPGAERLWALPGPSLCYVPELHSLSDPETISYQESNYLIYGSFNHTRKLTSSTQERFGAVLSATPDAVLQFRSHSFHDPAVRRYFLQRFSDVGISPHQLQPLPYAPSSAEAMSDYGRINLHLDSYPVSGTTTTLDSLAMGIPVLTCPTPYYAGTISAAILEHAGLADHICFDQADLPGHARWLAERFRSASARRSLAQQVRESAICDDEAMPLMFVEQLQQMLRQSLS